MPTTTTPSPMLRMYELKLVPRAPPLMPVEPDFFHPVEPDMFADNATTTTWTWGSWTVWSSSACDLSLNFALLGGALFLLWCIVLVVNHELESLQTQVKTLQDAWGALPTATVHVHTVAATGTTGVAKDTFSSAGKPRVPIPVTADTHS